MWPVKVNALVMLAIIGGETMRNFRVRSAEFNNPGHNSKTARHIGDNPSHFFQWKVLCYAQSQFKRPILELMIKKKNPSLSRQVHCFMAQLFPLGIT